MGFLLWSRWRQDRWIEDGEGGVGAGWGGQGDTHSLAASNVPGQPPVSFGNDI